MIRETPRRRRSKLKKSWETLDTKSEKTLDDKRRKMLQDKTVWHIRPIFDNENDSYASYSI